MQSKVLATIKKYNMLKSGDRVVVGLSGGADSVALLLLLHSLGKEYNLTLFAVHVNHGIRGEEADRDSKFAQELCSKLQINFCYRCFDVPKEAKKMGLSQEECGRVLRYQAFNKEAKEYSCNKIAVAHNLNDQSETVIMRLCRGTGITGLKGISPTRDNIIRPLIDCTRDEIETYLREKKQPYCTDSTNLLEEYARNKVRLKIIPYMEEELNKNSVINIAKTANILAEEDLYMEETATKAYNRALGKETDNGVYLKIEELKKLPVVILRRIIRQGFRHLKKDIKDLSYQHVESVIRILWGESGKKINLASPFGAKKEYEYLVLTGQESEKAKDFSYILTENTTVFVEELGANVEVSREKIKNVENCRNVCTKAVNYDKINNTLEIRNRRSGDTIAVNNMGGHKKLKDFFIDEKISRDKRDKMPLIVCQNQVVWVVGKRLSADFAVAQGDKNILYIHVWGD